MLPVTRTGTEGRSSNFDSVVRSNETNFNLIENKTNGPDERDDKLAHGGELSPIGLQSYDEIAQRHGHGGIIMVADSEFLREAQNDPFGSIQLIMDENKKRRDLVGADNVIMIDSPGDLLSTVEGKGATLLVIHAHVDQASGKIVFGYSNRKLNPRTLRKIREKLPKIEAICVIGCSLANFPTAQQYADRSGVVVYGTNVLTTIHGSYVTDQSGTTLETTVTEFENPINILIFEPFEPGP